MTNDGELGTHKETCESQELTLRFRDLPEKFETIVKQVDDLKTVCEAFLAAFKDRMAAEEAYAQSMSRIVNRIQFPDIPNASITTEGLKKFVEFHVSRRNEAETMANAIREDCIPMMKGMLAQHMQVFKKLVADGQRVINQRKEASNKVCKAESTFQLVIDRLSENEQENRFDLLQVAPGNPTTLVDQNIQAANRGVDILKTYSADLEAYSAVLEATSPQLFQIMDSLQDMETKKICCLKDALMKFYVYQTSQLKGLEYDLNPCVDVLEKIDPERDVQIFLETHKHGREEVLEFIPPQEQSLAIDHERYWEDAPFPVIKEFVDSVFEEEGEIDEDQHLKVLENLHLRGARSGLCEVLETHRLAGNVDCKKRMGFAHLQSTIKVALEHCLRHSEFGTARLLMLLSFHIKGELDGSPITLQNGLYSHTLFNRVQYWEEVLTCSLGEELIGLFVSKVKECPPDVLSKLGLDPHKFGFIQGDQSRFTKLCSHQLQEFVRLMSLFGIGTDAIVNVLTKEMAENESRWVHLGGRKYIKGIFNRQSSSAP